MSAADRVVRWATALVGSYELLIIVIRGSQLPADGTPGTGRDADPLHHANETTLVAALRVLTSPPRQVRQPGSGMSIPLRYASAE
jgi:hypothetical protein